MTQQEAIERLEEWLNDDPQIEQSSADSKYTYFSARLEYFKTLRANVAALCTDDWQGETKGTTVAIAVAIQLTHATIAALVNDDSAKPNVEIKA